MNNKFKNTIGAIIFSFFGYIIINNLLSDVAPRQNKTDKLKQNILMINQVQESNIILSNGTFMKTFDELAIGVIAGGSTANSQDFQYKIDVRSKDLATVGAKSLDREGQGLSGAVLRYKNLKGSLVTSSIVCKSEATGADGTDPSNAPIADVSGKLRCAPSWTVIKETQSEQPKKK